MSDAQRDQVRTAEVIASLSLATDLALGAPLEYGLRSTLVAMELCDRLAVDPMTASQAYYLCLLFYVGCTAPADVRPEIFGRDDALLTYGTPVRFGTRVEAARGLMRAVAPPTGSWPRRARQFALGGPRLALAFPGVVSATCEIGRMLTDRLGLGGAVSRLFAYEEERWSGKGLPNGVRGDQIPLPVRIVHVARDAAFHSLIGDEESAAEVIGDRAGKAFDPAIASLITEDAHGILGFRREGSLWDAVMAGEPGQWLTLEGESIDDALAAMGHFSDIAISSTVGHSSGVAALASSAAGLLALAPAEVATARRAALVHDLGRVAVSGRIWEKTDPLSVDDWEQVRLHAYHTERVLVRSPFLARLAPAASSHHERLDGSGYHRGVAASSLDGVSQVVAAADAYHAMTEPRPHRAALSSSSAAQTLMGEGGAGRLGSEAVAAVLEAAGHRSPPVDRPAGLTERELEVMRLLARGLQTKQIARELAISAKTADFHIQNAYRKIGVSTRAGAILFAMQHGLVTWENSL